MQSQYTRDVSPELMIELKEGRFAPFVDFVRNSNDLALCFRGNDSKYGKVVIYRYNHMIWELCLGRDGTPKVIINLDHARFMKNWRVRIIKELMDLGFTASDGRNYEQLDQEKDFVIRHRQKDGKYTYNTVKLEYYPSDNRRETENVVSKSYTVLIEMQEAFFSTEYKEKFDVYYPRSGKTKKEKRPRNYIKQYYLENHSDVDEDSNRALYCAFQPCVEKHVQQDLFLNNHFFKDGLFIYDLEFAQPKRDGISVDSRNKPDMLGIRFDQTGKMVAICMIEVKSKISALKGKKSGLKAHLEGMEEYLRIPTDNGLLMDDRKVEACRILNQYRELGFYGVKEVCSEDDFSKLKSEIVFIFSHEIVEDELDTILYRSLIVDEKNKGTHSVDDILQGFKSYDKVRCGENTGEIIVKKKTYS